jgi:hypothetical protein
MPIILAIVISSSLSAIVTMVKMRSETSINYVNASLYDLNNELDILIHLPENYPSDSFVRKKIESLMIGSILAMSESKRDLRKLEGVPLDTTYWAIQLLKV